MQKTGFGRYVVWVEGQKCFDFDDADQAVIGFVLAHSVLNCSFAKRYKGVGTLIQRYVLNIRDGAPVPEKTLNFVQRVG